MQNYRCTIVTIMLTGILFLLLSCGIIPTPPYGRVTVSFDLSKNTKADVDDFTRVEGGTVFLKQGGITKHEQEVTIAAHTPQDCTLATISYGDYDVIVEFYDSNSLILYSAEESVTVDHPVDNTVTLTLEKYIGTLVISGGWTEDIPGLATAHAELKQGDTTLYGMPLTLNPTEKTVSGVIGNIYPDDYELYIEVKDTSETVVFTGIQAITIHKGTNGANVTLLPQIGNIEIVINGDVTAPVITSGPEVSVSGRDVTITWTTDEPATSLVCYSGTEGFNYQSQITWAPIGGDIDADATEHSVTIYGLTEGNTYYYVVVTADESGNKRVSDEGSFGEGNGNVGVWQITTSILSGRAGHTSVMNNSYLYVIGGSYWKNDVLFTPINSNGTLGIWQTTTSFITGRWAHTSVVHNDFVYVLGGTDNSERNDVQFAPINSNGSLGNWQLTTSFIIGRDYHSSVVHNGYIYVIGGLQSGGELCRNDVQFAPINFDGTLGTWQTTTSFATERLDHTSVVYNGYLYIIGGREFDKNSQLNDVQFVLINSDGTLGTWQTTTSFNISRSGHTSVVQNGYLYILGGYDGNSYRNDVEFALINSNGTLGTWHTTTSFGTGRHGHTSVVYNNYLYVIGGYQGAEPFLNDVQYTQFF